MARLDGFLLFSLAEKDAYLSGLWIRGVENRTRLVVHFKSRLAGMRQPSATPATEFDFAATI
jgi:hypothetical protein